MSQPAPSFPRTVKPWIFRRQVSIYLRGRNAPLTGLTILSVDDSTIIARWNASTHLIPTDQVSFIRFAPDSDPSRDTTHPLHELTKCKHLRSAAKPQKNSELENHPDGTKTVGEILKGITHGD